MQTRTIILFIGLFVAVVVGMFTFTYLKRQEMREGTPPPTLPVASSSTTQRDTINATHYFIDGVHTFVGQIDMPTPCDLLQSAATVRESMPEQVTLAFTTLNNDPACTQVITAQRFKVEAVASRDAIITATLMGESVELNLTPAPRGEKPEQFELFIKG